MISSLSKETSMCSPELTADYLLSASSRFEIPGVLWLTNMFPGLNPVLSCPREWVITESSRKLKQSISPEKKNSRKSCLLDTCEHRYIDPYMYVHKVGAWYSEVTHPKQEQPALCSKSIPLSLQIKEIVRSQTAAVYSGSLEQEKYKEPADSSQDFLRGYPKPVSGAGPVIKM